MKRVKSSLQNIFQKCREEEKKSILNEFVRTSRFYGRNNFVFFLSVLMILIKRLPWTHHDKM